MPTADRGGAATVPATDVASRRPGSWHRLATALVAAGLAGVAYADGGYGLTARSILAIALWAAVVLAVALGLAPRVRLTRPALAAGALLAAFALWTLVSMAWAPSAELAFVAFDRASLYLALYLVVVGTTRNRDLGWWLEGLRLGIVVTALLALTSRLFPGVFAGGGIALFVPNAATRLSFPVGYWNGLAILVSFALPLSFRAALAGRTPASRALALAPVPLLSAVVFLTSSRGGVLAAIVGVAVFLAGSGRRWASLVVVLIGAAGSLLAVLVLRLHPVLVDGPFGGGAARSEGRLVAALILCVAAVTGALLPAGERLWGYRRAPSPRVGRALFAATVLLLLAAVLAAHPLRRFAEFRQPPAAFQTSSTSFVTAHLTSGSGSGRWQFWVAAVHEWESAPLVGGGAGSYRFWWAEHASFTYFLKNAHSLYLEVLGELGIVGALLLGGALGSGIVAAVRGFGRTEGRHREALAAAAGVFAAFLVGAGLDWVWQLTVVGAVGIVALALVARGGAEPLRETNAPRRGSLLALGAVALIAAWAAICAQAIPWLTATRVADSQAAARRGDLAKALKDARDATSIQPWAATPYLQLALVAEAQGDLPAALRWVDAAIARDDANWANWYIASRIEREAGHPAAARRDYLKARSLDVRSPLFAGPPHPP